MSESTESIAAGTLPSLSSSPSGNLFFDLSLCFSEAATRPPMNPHSWSTEIVRSLPSSIVRSRVPARMKSRCAGTRPQSSTEALLQKLFFGLPYSSSTMGVSSKREDLDKGEVNEAS